MEVRRKSDIRKVFDVLVEMVDQVCELLRFCGELGGGVVAFRGFRYCDILFIYPHLHIRMKDVWVCLRVLRYDLCDGGSPTTISTYTCSLHIKAYQLPEPTTVTLCFCSWLPRVAMALIAAGQRIE